MSLAGFETITIHLGWGVAWAQPGSGPVHTLVCDKSTSFAHMLSLVQDALASPSTVPNKPRKFGKFGRLLRPALRVTLSAYWCRPVAVQPPAGLRAWSELLTIAQQQSASALGCAPDAVHCMFAERDLGVVGAMRAQDYETLQLWATQSGYRHQSTLPTWGLATQCPAAQAPAIQALVLHEEDGHTVLNATRPMQAAFFPKDLPSDNTSSDTTTADAIPLPLRRLLVGWGVAQTQQLHLRLSATPQTKAALNTPKIWPQHWSVL